MALSDIQDCGHLFLGTPYPLLRYERSVASRSPAGIDWRTRRWSSLPLQSPNCEAMAAKVTLKQVQICLPRACTVMGGLAPGTSSMRP